MRAHTSVAIAAVCALVTVVGERAAGQQAVARPNVRELARHADDARWHVAAVEYARSSQVRESRLVRGAPPGGRVDMSWYFFVAVGHGRVALVDAGSDALSRPGRAELRQRWAIAHAIPVTAALARVGIAPSDVTDVVLTHHHWDHVDGLRAFGVATVHAMRAEWPSIPQRLRAPVERTGRLHALSQSPTELFEGFEVREAGAHTSHQLMAKIECAEGPIVIASDAAYLYRNIHEDRPVTVTTDRESNLVDVAAAVREVGADNVIPGHDPSVFDRYPSSVDGVAAICP